MVERLASLGSFFDDSASDAVTLQGFDMPADAFSLE